MLKIGDVVRLKSGGPLMTVDYIVGNGSHDMEQLLYQEGFKNGDVVCQWFEDGDLRAKTFKPEVLQKLELYRS